MPYKAVAHILLLVFFIQLFGMTAVYFSQRYSVKQTAIKIIESNNEHQFTFLKLSELEFQLAKFEEQELFINGQLFDIIEKKFEDGYVIVKVFRDTKEESFLKKTIDWFDASNPSKSSLPKLIFKTFFNPIILCNNFIFSIFNSVSVKMYNNLLLCFLNVCIKPFTPPPLV